MPILEIYTVMANIRIKKSTRTSRHLLGRSICANLEIDREKSWTWNKERCIKTT